MDAELASKPFRPSPALCCEGCVFGRGEHAEFCLKSYIAVSWASCMACHNSTGNHAEWCDAPEHG